MKLRVQNVQDVSRYFLRISSTQARNFILLVMSSVWGGEWNSSLTTEELCIFAVWDTIYPQRAVGVGDVTGADGQN